MNQKYIKAKNCTCATDGMVKLGLAVACHNCAVARHKQALDGKYKTINGVLETGTQAYRGAK